MRANLANILASSRSSQRAEASSAAAAPLPSLPLVTGGKALHPGFEVGVRAAAAVIGVFAVAAAAPQVSTPEATTGALSPDGPAAVTAAAVTAGVPTAVTAVASTTGSGRMLPRFLCSSWSESMSPTLAAAATGRARTSRSSRATTGEKHSGQGAEHLCRGEEACICGCAGKVAGSD